MKDASKMTSSEIKKSLLKKGKKVKRKKSAKKEKSLTIIISMFNGLLYGELNLSGFASHKEIGNDIVVPVQYEEEDGTAVITHIHLKKKKKGRSYFYQVIGIKQWAYIGQYRGGDPIVLTKD